MAYSSPSSASSYDSGISDSSYSGNTGYLGEDLGISPDSFDSNSGFGYTDNVMDIPGMELMDMYSQDWGPSYSTNTIDNDYTGGTPAYSNGLPEQDWWDSPMGRFVKSAGKFALSTTPLGRAGLTAYGIYDAAKNRNYGGAVQGLVSAATNNGLLGSVAGITTNAAMGKDVSRQVGGTFGSFMGGQMAGPLGAMVGGQAGAYMAGRTPGINPGAQQSVGQSPQAGSGLDMEQLVAGLGSLYLNNKAAKEAGSNVQSLNSMFGPNSAYSQQLRQRLERRDAASGRRSQYGPREVELQAKLAEMAANYGPRISQANMQAQALKAQRKQQNLAALYAMGRESGLFDYAGEALSDLFS